MAGSSVSLTWEEWAPTTLLEDVLNLEYDVPSRVLPGFGVTPSVAEQHQPQRLLRTYQSANQTLYKHFAAAIVTDAYCDMD